MNRQHCRPRILVPLIIPDTDTDDQHLNNLVTQRNTTTAVIDVDGEKKTNPVTKHTGCIKRKYCDGGQRLYAVAAYTRSASAQNDKL